MSTSPREADPKQAGSGRYKVMRFLGQGANKRVHLAHDERLDREVALAEIKSSVLGNEGRSRLQRETQAMAQLGDHPGIVTVFDVLHEDDHVYIVSQFMAGGDLADRLGDQPEGRLPLDQTLAMALQIASALEHAHERKLIHRDIKPSNIWLTADGTAKLGDFGLAFALDRTRLTQEGMMVGTAYYMPPEQALGHWPDTRSDLYALGATMYEMATGRPPFLGDDAVAVVSQHINTRPVAPRLLAEGIPEPLERLILDLLEKDPTARPAGAGVVRERLEDMIRAPTLDRSGTTPGANPLDRLASGVFVGREAEVERGRAVCDEAFAGQPRVLLLVGEPGIGKTRISEELTTYARLRGARVFWGRCHEGEGAPPFWPWVQIVRSFVQASEPEALRRAFGFGAADIAGLVSEVRQALPDLQEPAKLDPEQTRFRLFDALVGFLRNAARETPLVLVLDDLHWSDKPSLLLLEFLARELGPARLLVIATYRDVELRRQHPLSETLAELTRLHLDERVLLRGLTEADVARFIEQSANIDPPEGLVAAIHRETEGNPFFVHEVVRLLTSDGRLTKGSEAASWSLEIPQGVREVVGRRLNRLSEDCNELLLIGSVLGREFSLPVLERVSEIDLELALVALDEALGARVISEVAGPVATYRFSHALMRETLYEELSTPRRVKLHRRAGEVLEEVHGEEAGSHLAEIANHFFCAVQSGELERAVGASVRAAEWAGERQAFEEEAQHYLRAIEVLEMGAASDDRRLAELTVRLARAQAVGGNPEAARKSALQAADLARRVGSPELLAQAALAYGAGFLFVEMGRVDAPMVDLLQEALDGLTGRDDPASRALIGEVSVKLSHELYFGGDQARIGALVDTVDEIAEELDDDRLRSAALQARATSSSWNRLELMPELTARMRSLARTSGDVQRESTAVNYKLTTALRRGDRAAVHRGPQMRRSGSHQAAAFRWCARFRSGLAPRVCLLEGRFAELRPLIAEAVGLMSQGSGTNARQWGAILLYLGGRHLGQLRVTEEVVGFVERFPDYLLYRAYLAAVQTATGDLDAARINLELPWPKTTSRPCPCWRVCAWTERSRRRKRRERCHQ